MLSLKYESEYEKMAELCLDNNLEFSFSKDSYPVVVTIERAAERQRSLYEEEQPAMDAGIKFIFRDRLIVKMEGDLVLDEKTLNKIKNQAKRLHYIFLQSWFEMQMAAERKGD